MNQFRPVTMIAKTTPGTHNPRISAQIKTHRLREIGERSPYAMYVLYAAFLFWPSIGFYAYAIIVHIGADQLLPQLLMEQFDTFHIKCRHIEHMHKGVWFRKNNF